VQAVRGYTHCHGKHLYLLEASINVLEDDAFEIILVNARHVKNIPSHKTNKKDSA
jgi:hypothetical protein